MQIGYASPMTRAFSLVELSIVLVILGLLTGGILAGQSLIRAAEIRSIATEYERFTAATQTFRDKYFALPGDMNNATRFWARTVNAAHCVTSSAAAVGTPGTCDGNANGTINGGAAASESGEIFQFWRHLALAGLIEGTYTGIASTASYEHSVIGGNIPASKLSNAGWSAWASNYAGDASSYAMDYGNGFMFGGVTTSKAQNAIIKPEEAWNIDTKLDDGRPAYGKIIARHWSTCNIVNSGVASFSNYDTSYNLTSTASSCALHLRQLF